VRRSRFPSAHVNDGDTALSVTISGLPVGATLVDLHLDPPVPVGTVNSNGSVTLTQAQLTGLALISDGEDQHFNLTVTATAIDGGNAATAASTTSTLHVDVAPLTGTTTVAAQFDQAGNVLNFNNHTIETNTTNQVIQITANQPAVALHATGNHFTADGLNETLDLSNWDRAVEIDFLAGTIKLDATSLTPSGTISGFANVVGTSHNDSFDNLTGGITVTGGTGADHFSLASNASNVLNSSNIPTIKNFSPANESIDLSALLENTFGKNPTAPTSNFVKITEDAGGSFATISVNANATGVAADFHAVAQLDGVQLHATVTAILDHAQHTAQLHT
jgi:hypothetical protein